MPHAPFLGAKEFKKQHLNYTSFSSINLSFVQFFLILSYQLVNIRNLLYDSSNCSPTEKYQQLI